MELPSYSSVAAKGFFFPPSTNSAAATLNRRTSTRFTFESRPDEKAFRDALCQVINKDTVKCIQTLPGGRVDVTLKHETSAMKLVEQGITLDKQIFKPRSFNHKIAQVYIQYLPAELASDIVTSTMKQYGNVLEVKRQVYEDSQIETGTRVVKMEIHHAIPSFVTFANYRGKVWHRGQTQTCSYCVGVDHYRKDCPYLIEHKDLTSNQGKLRVQLPKTFSTSDNKGLHSDKTGNDAETHGPNTELLKTTHSAKPITKSSGQLLADLLKSSEAKSDDKSSSGSEADSEIDLDDVDVYDLPGPKTKKKKTKATNSGQPKPVKPPPHPPKQTTPNTEQTKDTKEISQVQRIKTVTSEQKDKDNNSKKPSDTNPNSNSNSLGKTKPTQPQETTTHPSQANPNPEPMKQDTPMAKPKEKTETTKTTSTLDTQEQNEITAMESDQTRTPKRHEPPGTPTKDKENKARKKKKNKEKNDVYTLPGPDEC